MTHMGRESFCNNYHMFFDALGRSNFFRAIMIFCLAALLIMSFGCRTIDPNVKETRHRRYSIDQFNIGLGHEKNEDYDAALVFYRRSLNASPRPVVYYHMGYIYSIKGNYIQAKGFLEKALENNENFEAARLELEKVNLALDELAALDESSTETLSLSDFASRVTTNFDEFEAIEVEPQLPTTDEVEARLFPGLASPGSDEANDEELRILSYQRAHMITLPSAELHRRQAEDYTAGGYLQEAIKEYQDALTFDTNDVQSRLGLARIYERTGRIKIAEEQYLKAEQADPESADVTFQIGNFYFRQKLYINAERYFEKTLSLMPDHRSALNNLSAAQIKLNKSNDARKTLEKLIDVDPQFVNAYLNLGILYDDHFNDDTKALENYQKYLELGGPNRERVEEWISKIQTNNVTPAP